MLMFTMIIFVNKIIVSSIIIESLLLLSFHVFGCFELNMKYRNSIYTYYITKKLWQILLSLKINHQNKTEKQHGLSGRVLRTSVNMLQIIDFFFFLLSLTFKSERCKNLNFKSLFACFCFYQKRTFRCSFVTSQNVKMDKIYISGQVIVILHDR